MYFKVEEGECEVTVNGCVNSPNYPAPHENNEYCRITVHETGAYSLSDPFDVEDGYDHLTVDGQVTFLFVCEERLLVS